MSEVLGEVNNLSSFIQFVENTYRTYPNGRGMNNPSIKTLAFRGCADENYSLIPSLFRKNIKSFDEEQTVENDLYLSITSEQIILKDFIKYASNYINIDAGDFAHWAEYAQHFGVPTRFLDWTDNPLVSLYFACLDEEKDGCVWILHKPNYSRYVEDHDELTNPKDTIGESINAMMRGESKNIHKMPILYQPNFVDDRMRAQESLFMSWGYEKKALDEQLPEKLVYIKSIDQLSRSTKVMVNDSNGIIFKVRIPKRYKRQLLRDLDVVSINEMTLFPGLDGIGRYIEKRYRFNYQEAIDNFV